MCALDVILSHEATYSCGESQRTFSTPEDQIKISILGSWQASCNFERTNWVYLALGRGPVQAARDVLVALADSGDVVVVRIQPHLSLLRRVIRTVDQPSPSACALTSRRKRYCEGGSKCSVKSRKIGSWYFQSVLAEIATGALQIEKKASNKFPVHQRRFHTLESRERGRERVHDAIDPGYQRTALR